MYIILQLNFIAVGTGRVLCLWNLFGWEASFMKALGAKIAHI